MSPFKPTRIECLSFLILVPFIITATCYLLFGARFFREAHVFFYGSLALLFIGMVSWYLHITSMHLLALLLPELSHTILRLFLLVLTHLILISATMTVYFYGFDAVNFLGYRLNTEDYKLSLWVGFMLTLITTTLWQTEFIFNKWKDSLSEKELVEQQRLQHEFESLKRQINPHFLFNNLNALSSLISEDPAKAEYFLDELSKVYRYLLRSNEDGISSLHEELQFIRSYYALLKIRYSDAILIHIDVDQKYESYLLPSLSLQLLVENAVKHNLAIKSQPLHIAISTNGSATLKVRNNLQKKPGNVLSNKLGLTNIIYKYRLLNQTDVTIQEDNQSFTVVLPLMDYYKNQ